MIEATTFVDALQVVVDKYNERAKKKGKKPTTVDALLGSMLRTCVTARAEQTLFIADFAQIEARVNAWVNGQDNVLQQFAAYDIAKGDEKKKADPYRNMAAQVWGIDVLEVNDFPQRYIGKQLVLGAGFFLGGGKFELYCLKEGIDLAAAGTSGFLCIKAYRAFNKKIVAGWKLVNDAAIKAVKTGEPQRAAKCLWERIGGPRKTFTLKMTPPSGLPRYYQNARIEDIEPPYVKTMKLEPFTKPTLVYDDPRRGRRPTHGGSLMENLVQGIARDIMVQKKMALLDDGFHPLLEVHDEIITEEFVSADDPSKFHRVIEVMRQPLSWTAGLPIQAEGFISPRYKK